jgi:hypothetical protein
MLPSVVDVSALTGQKVSGQVTSWVTPDGPMLVEHLAGRSDDGSVHVFWWSPRNDWQVHDVSARTGRTVASSLESWVTGNVEHLAGQAPDGSLLVFWWTPRTDWRVVNATDITGEPVAGRPAAYQLQAGSETEECLAARNPDSSLMLCWWKPSLDWQALYLSEATGADILAPPAAWHGSWWRTRPWTGPPKPNPSSTNYR